MVPEDMLVALIECWGGVGESPQSQYLPSKRGSRQDTHGGKDREQGTPCYGQKPPKPEGWLTLHMHVIVHLRVQIAYHHTWGWMAMTGFPDKGNVGSEQWYQSPINT